MQSGSTFRALLKCGSNPVAKWTKRALFNMYDPRHRATAAIPLATFALERPSGKAEGSRVLQRSRCPAPYLLLPRPTEGYRLAPLPPTPPLPAGGAERKSRSRPRRQGRHIQKERRRAERVVAGPPSTRGAGRRAAPVGTGAELGGQPGLWSVGRRSGAGALH